MDTGTFVPKKILAGLFDESGRKSAPQPTPQKIIEFKQTTNKWMYEQNELHVYDIEW